MATLMLEYHQDSAGGWVAVPHSLIEDMGISVDISSSSYLDDAFVYLEEEKDVGLLVAKVRDFHLDLDLVLKLSNTDSFVRSLRQYSVKRFKAAIGLQLVDHMRALSHA